LRFAAGFDFATALRFVARFGRAAARARVSFIVAALARAIRRAHDIRRGFARPEDFARFADRFFDRFTVRPTATDDLIVPFARRQMRRLTPQIFTI
jgi:hypothetical protein